MVSAFFFLNLAPTSPRALHEYIYVLSFGLQELEEVGGMEELEKEINRRIKSSDSSWIMTAIL